jgi:ribosomal protein L16/L10AE
MLVYISTRPFRGKRTNLFTYEVQQEGLLEQALSSAATHLPKQLEAVNTQHLPWDVREHYFPYRSETVIKTVRQNRRTLIKMLNAETALIDGLVNFGAASVRKNGLVAAHKTILKTIKVQLGRFCPELGFGTRAGSLLHIATSELIRVREAPTRTVPR